MKLASTELLSEDEAIDMEMTNCVGGILDEITNEPCHEMEMTACVGGLLTKSDMELADELMDMTVCVGDLVTRPTVQSEVIEPDNACTTDSNVLITQTSCREPQELVQCDNAMEMTACVGDLLNAHPNQETNLVLASNNMDVIAQNDAPLQYNLPDAEQDGTQMEMTTCIGGLVEKLEIMTSAQLTAMELTQCVGGILDRMNQSDGLKMTAYSGGIDESISKEMDMILSNIPTIDDEISLLEELSHGSINDINQDFSNAPDVKQGPYAQSINSDTNLNDQMNTSCLEFLNESPKQQIPNDMMEFTQVVGSLIADNITEMPSFLYQNEESFTADSCPKNDVESKPSVSSTVPVPIKNKSDSINPLSSTTKSTSIDFLDFLPNENNFVSTFPSSPSAFDSAPKASLKEFLDKIEVRFLDNLKSKARRETIVKQRDSEIITLPQQAFLKNGTLIEVDCYELACTSLNKVIGQKRTAISSMEHLFNYHPPSILKDFQADKPAVIHFLKSLKSNVRVWAKCDWRKFRLNFSRHLLEKLTNSFNLLNANLQRSTEVFEELQRESDTLSNICNSLTEKHQLCQQKEINFQNLDLQLINSISCENEKLKLLLQEKQNSLASLRTQRSSLEEELTRYRKKERSINLCIEQSKQLIEQHKIINQNEINQQRMRLDFVAKLFGFKLTKVSPLVIEIQFNWKFSLILQLQADSSCSCNTLDTVLLTDILCCNPDNDPDCLLLEQLLKKKIFKPAQSNNAESGNSSQSKSSAIPDSSKYLLRDKFYKIALYVQRFIKLHQTIIQRLRARYVIECDFKRACYVAKKRTGEQVIFYFDDQLSKMANINKL